MFWMIVIIIIAIVVLGFIASRVIWSAEKETPGGLDEKAPTGEFPSLGEEEAERERSERL
ncbi:MAG TPA: hypothetical protein VFG50_00435 [Rhodothermales bacterium]|nr:hypothetical protein [Rhodothermales bacterium]